MKLRVGIIGVGLLGMRHAGHWSRLPVTLAGFYDANAEQAQRAVDTFGGRVFASADELARSVDVVHIASPTPFHKEGVLAAAAHGKHVFSEKPLARTVVDAQAMVDACERAGVRLYVGQTVRFFGQYVYAKRQVEAGAIGKPHLLRLTRAGGHPYGYQQRAWFRSVEQSGGTVMEGSIHDFDFARWCMGDVERVFARGITYDDALNAHLDHALVTLYFKNGAVGHVEGSWLATDGRLRQAFEVVGDEGSIRYDSHAKGQVAVALRAQASSPTLPLPPQGALDAVDDPYFLQLQHFLACLQHDTEFRVKPQDGVEAVRLCVAVLASMRTGQVVQMAEMI